MSVGNPDQKVYVYAVSSLEPLKQILSASRDVIISGQKLRLHLPFTGPGNPPTGKTPKNRGKLQNCFPKNYRKNTKNGIFGVISVIFQYFPLFSGVGVSLSLSLSLSLLLSLSLSPLKV